VIHDFEQGADVIYLVEINAKLGGSIDYIGLNVGFNGQAGQLRTVTDGDNTILQLDSNGDKKADFSVQLDGHYTLTDTDFVLTI
jgi:peptidase M10/serralysin-like protein